MDTNKIITRLFFAVSPNKIVSFSPTPLRPYPGVLCMGFVQKKADKVWEAFPVDDLASAFWLDDDAQETTKQTNRTLIEWRLRIYIRENVSLAIGEHPFRKLLGFLNLEISFKAHEPRRREFMETYRKFKEEHPKAADSFVFYCKGRTHHSYVSRMIEAAEKGAVTFEADEAFEKFYVAHLNSPDPAE